MIEEVPFGAWLKQRRKKLGLTQRDLAQRIGYSAVMIEKIEAGTRRPSRQMVELIADTFDVPQEQRRAFLQLAGMSADTGSPTGRPEFAERITQEGAAPTEATATGEFAGAGLGGALLTGRHNLPAQRTPFIGRAGEVAEAVNLLRRSAVRLLTMTGPPGIGKTRLSLEVAARLLGDFRDGVYFVALGPVQAASRQGEATGWSQAEERAVIAAIAQAFGVRESGNRPLLESLESHLRDREVLLVLDNFEHLIPAAPVTASLLTAAAYLKILASSREVLHVYGEHNFAVPPLKVPSPKALISSHGLGSKAPQTRDLGLEALESYESVRLFVERACAVRRDFALTEQNAQAVAEICARLEGLPLAIELAAARVSMLTPQQIVPRLHERLRLLVGGPRDLPPRQQALRTAIEWSYDLLDEQERTLFRRLAVFVGGCTLEAADAVCSIPDVLQGLTSLADRSLLRVETAGDGRLRFAMLETIREYAWERLLESGEARMIQARHAECFAQLAETAAPELRGGGQIEWLEQLDAEHDNFRTALRWALSSADNPEATQLGLRIAGALGRFWEVRGHLSEGRQWLASILDFGPPADKYKIATALTVAGRLAMHQGDYEAARSCYERGLGLARELGEKKVIANLLNNLGMVSVAHGDYEAAGKLFQEGLQLRRELGDKHGIAVSLASLSTVALAKGDSGSAREMASQSLEIRREIGNMQGMVFALSSLGDAARYEGDYDLSAAMYAEAQQLATQLGDRPSIANTLHNLGHVWHHRGQVAQAEALFKESLRLYRELDDLTGIAECLAGLAGVAASQIDRPDHARRAALLFGAADAQLDALGFHLFAADRLEYDRNLAATRAALSEGEFLDAWERGRNMPLGQVLADLLGD